MQQTAYTPHLQYFKNAVFFHTNLNSEVFIFKSLTIILSGYNKLEV